MNGLLATLLHVTASNVVVAALLAILAWSAGRWLRRPALSHALWLLVLLKLLTPPVVPVTVWRTTASPEVATPATTPQPPVALAPEVSDVAGVEVGDSDVDVSDVGIAAPPVAGVVGEGSLPARFFEPELNDAAPVRHDVGHVANVPEGPSRLEIAVTIVVAVWLAGSLLWLAVAVRRLIAFQKLLRHAEPAPGQIRALAEELANRIGVRCPAVVVMPGRLTPLVWCLLGSPRLVIPAALVNRFDTEQLRTLLAHELAHLRRRDHWVRWLEFAVVAVYWWCPLAWWARRQLQQAEEECCDAWVVWALPEAARTYAAALVDTVDFLAGARPILPVTASGLGHLHLLKRRLTMILRGTTPRAMGGGGLAVVLGLGAALLPLMPTWAQEPPPSPSQPEATPVRVQRGDDITEDPKPRPTPARTTPRKDTDNREELERELNRMQREMAELQNQMALKQRRIAELAKRLGTPRPSPYPQTPPSAVPPGVPPAPTQPRYTAPEARVPFFDGPMSVPPPVAPPPGHLERRIENLERKLDAVLRQLESRQPSTTPAPPRKDSAPRPMTRQPVQPRQAAPPAPVPEDESAPTPRVPPPPPDRRPGGADNVPGQPPAPAPAGPVGLPPTAVVPAP